MAKKKPKKKLYNIHKKYYPKNKRDFVDQDYIDKLSPEDKEWMDKFLGEYYRGNFDKDNEKNLHKTKEEKKDCYDRNNASNRDLYAIFKSGGAIIFLGDELAKMAERFSEDAIVKISDLKKTTKKGKKEDE